MQEAKVPHSPLSEQTLLQQELLCPALKGMGRNGTGSQPTGARSHWPGAGAQSAPLTGKVRTALACLHGSQASHDSEVFLAVHATSTTALQASRANSSPQVDIPLKS